MSVIAQDAANGKICGAFTSVDANHFYSPSFGDSWRQFKLGFKMFSALGDGIEYLEPLVGQMNCDLVNELEQLKKVNKMKSKEGILLEMIAVGVHKDYARRGIGKELTNLLLENSKKHGFCMSKAECTSLYSTKALTKNGAVVEK